MGRFNTDNIKTFTENYLKTNHPDFYKYLFANYPSDLTIQEKAYWYIHDINTYPICPVCGKRVHFACMSKGYRHTCSLKCSRRSQEYWDKIKQTNLKKYGVENPFANKDIQDKIKQTNLKKYGVKNASQSKEIIEKTKQTNLERYGVTCTLHNDKIREKTRQTCLERYNVETPFLSDDIKKKIKQTCLERYGGTGWGSSLIKKKTLETYKQQFLSKYPDIIDVSYSGGQSNTIYTCTCPHPECDKCKSKTFEIDSLTYWVRKNNNTELCTSLLPKSESISKGTSIEMMVRDILDCYHIEYECNTRNIIPHYELDIYIPSKNIAIECNGIFWHSTYRKTDNEYHINKRNACIEQNIQLITIWEDWVVRKRDIVESILLSKLGIYKERIYARKCEIKEIDSRTCNNFLDMNHIQGRSSSKIKLGLYYNEELVSVMTFGQPRIAMGNAHGGWELVRFCNKTNIQIVGGASKLFKYFITRYNPENIISFSSNDISEGKLYNMLGFTLTSTSKNSYWYIDNEFNRYHRFTFSKQSLKKKGIDVTNKTESDIMQEKGYYKIYDTGQRKWVYTPSC